MTRLRARCWISAPVRRRAVWAFSARSRTASPSVGASAGSGPQAVRRRAAATAGVRRIQTSLAVEIGRTTPGSGRCSLAPGAEEGAQKVRAFPGQDAAGRLRPPVAGRLVEEAGTMGDGAALGVVRAPDDAADAGVADGPGAHGAGLERDIEGQAGEPVVAPLRRRRAQGDDLGVGGRIVGADRAVHALGDDLAGGFVDDDAADGSLSRVRRRLRTGQGHVHEPLIMASHPRDNDKKPRPRQDGDRDGPRKPFAKGPGKGPAKPGGKSFGKDGKPGPKADEAPKRSERIAKAMARAGIASRREVERLIGPGRVAVNGKILDTPTAGPRAGRAAPREAERVIGLGRVAVNGKPPAPPATRVTRDDAITVDGKPIGSAQATRVWRYHKPAGLVTSHGDPQGRPTVF